MNRRQFYHVLETAITWDNVSDEDMKYPEFENNEELELFEHFLDMLNNTDYLEKIGFKDFYKPQDAINSFGE